MRTFAEVVHARQGDDKEGLRFEGESLAWDEIVRESAVRASLLRQWSPGEGRHQRHVGILLQNVPDFVFWIFGAALTGDVVVGVNPTRRGAELAHDISHADCDLLITENVYTEELESAGRIAGLQTTLNVDSSAYEELLEAHRNAPLPELPSNESDPFLLLFSSGSTGAPKAVICSHGRLGRLTDAMTDRVSLHRESVNYLCLPLFHGHAIMMNLATAANVGATVVMVRKFSASRFISDIQEHKVTFFNYVGRILSHVIVTHPPRDSDRNNSLEVAFGSEAAPAEVAELRGRFGCEVREGYGASEGVLRIVPTPDSPESALGLPAGDLEVTIRDPETNEECPRARFDENGLLLNADEATGEMVAMDRGPSFEGYYKNPGAMGDRLKFGGQDFWTGDLGYRDQAGYFYFGGRSSDWLRVDGENFSTAPVERILIRHGAFSGVHCYGVPHPLNGDMLMCAVTLDDGEKFEPESFAHFLEEQPDLGTKWSPAFVRVVDSVPVTGSGKVDKPSLRAEAWEAPDVWYRPERETLHRPFTDDDRQGMRQRFVANGRENSLPSVSRRLLVSG